MKFVLQPWQLFFLILAGWINRRQQEIIDFQNAQIVFRGSQPISVTRSPILQS
jgi:hypothetical protein